MIKELSLENKVTIISLFGAVVCGLLTFLISGNFKFSLFILLYGISSVSAFYCFLDSQKSSRSDLLLKRFFSFFSVAVLLLIVLPLFFRLFVS